MMPSSLDTGNPAIDDDFSLRVLIIRLTASSNLAFGEESRSSTIGSSRMLLLNAADADAVLDAIEAEAGFTGYRCETSPISRSRRNTSRFSSSASRDATARVLAMAELGFWAFMFEGNDLELSLYIALRES